MCRPLLNHLFHGGHPLACEHPHPPPLHLRHQPLGAPRHLGQAMVEGAGEEGEGSPCTPAQVEEVEEGQLCRLHPQQASQ